MQPHQHTSIQYSLHILEEDGSLTHAEYLADEAQLPKELIEQMRHDFGETGSVVSWHKSFEQSRK
jgi:predicted transcriptional regulator